MLVNIDAYFPKSDSIQALIKLMSGEAKDEDFAHVSEFKVADGVYIGPFMNASNFFDNNKLAVFDKFEAMDRIKKENPDNFIQAYHDFIDKAYGTEEPVEEYGVCDNYEQILKKWPELATNDSQFFILLDPIRRDEQPEHGSWRWHKWGEYIGKHEIQHEYLYDEEGIDVVYCYHIYMLPQGNGIDIFKDSYLLKDINLDSKVTFDKDYGDVFSLEEFLDMAEGGSIIDYDGSASEIIVNGFVVKDRGFSPEDTIEEKELLHKLQEMYGPVQIVWYNK